MNVRYSLGDYTLKVLGCDKSLDVLDFYYRNRNDFDIYESDKPEAFYTEEFIKNMLNAENKALMSLHFVRFFLVSNDNPDYIIGTISLSHINRGSSPSANMGYKIDRLNRGKGLASLMIAHMLDVVIPDLGTARLADKVREYGHITTGFLGTPYICHVLSEWGYTDLAYMLLLRPERKP